MTDLVAFLAAWERRIAKMQRAHPERWHVPGLSDEEVRDAITLALMEEPDVDAWPIVESKLAELRKRFRLPVAPADLRRAPIRDRALDQEEALLAHEGDAAFADACTSAEASLGRPQRRWLAAMKMAANNGAFFRTSDVLNLSEAARILGKNRSSAARAYAELRDRFKRFTPR
jgi:hypothetical protein